MSAYIVSDETITAIVKGLSKYCRDYSYFFNHDEEELGQILLDENYRSVNYRYDEETKPHHFVIRELEEFNDNILFGCLMNYEYQTCETDDYNSTLAGVMVHNVMKEMLRKRIKSQYGDYPWGL